MNRALRSSVNAVCEKMSLCIVGVRSTFCQHARSTAGSQKSGPTVGGLMYCAAGSLAPSGLFKVGPPGIPGKPRPAPENTGALPGAPAPGSSRLVVVGVMMFAGSPRVGADTG